MKLRSIQDFTGYLTGEIWFHRGFTGSASLHLISTRLIGTRSRQQ
ncbi:hypothetical protein HMPREF0043_00564 [Actinobaculum sp. oral taxon 183 str. F0552]|nr:hypothetical protein HMPREF0043_00564 [Actinobaculum sp. oral taxon 183 str. F0552]